MQLHSAELFIASSLILAAPLIMGIMTWFAGAIDRKLCCWTAFFGIFSSLLLTCFILSKIGWHGRFEFSVPWIMLPELVIEFGILIDSLSLLMLFIVTGVGSLIFLYSMEYMAHDTGYSRYFTCLSLFAFAMLGIVLSNNFVQLFIFWELVGLSSYLLIGFWYEKETAADAGKKAFITNRLGDYGFLLGILSLWMLQRSFDVNSLSFQSVENVIHLISAHKAVFAVTCLLIFCGVLGKSAQLPLHVWLPDAMEGPTPVSALIHAATMVAAGIFLLARTFFMFAESQIALTVISYVGVFTAFIAATQALVQTDIKRILAYSTLSQLGLMVLAIGLGSSSSAMYHLTTHAFFKALLFLGAGCFIHALHEQNIERMGGLFRQMPVTSSTFMIGALALAGVYPLSGFWSKDEIILLAFQSNLVFFWFSTATSVLTAIYITRLVTLVMFSKNRSQHTAHEPSWQMCLPLVVLAVPSALAGFWHLEPLIHQHADRLVEKNLFPILVSSGLGILAIACTFFVYQFQRTWAANWNNRLFWLTELLRKKYYWDDFYDWIVSHIQKPFSEACSIFEKWVVVKMLVNGLASLTIGIGRRFAHFQTGKVQHYITFVLVGFGLVAYFSLRRLWHY